jgi:hypothetical protein
LEYIGIVERRLSRARGRDAVLSPRDFALAGRWYRAGVPVDWIIRRIDELTSDGGSVGSLALFESHIEARLRVRR